ncbi:hypothetical protein KQI84_01705 [bacterium]|nr:hypothetical protein [bacterium]
MVRLVLWSTFLLLLLILWGREILVLGAAQREKEETRFENRRFRRRTTGLFVLLLLAGCYDLSNYLDPYLTARGAILYYGMCFIILIWLLIIATRDVRAEAIHYMEEQNQVTLQALLELERRVAMRDDPDWQRIPPLEFPKKDEDEAEEPEAEALEEVEPKE